MDNKIEQVAEMFEKESKTFTEIEKCFCIFSQEKFSKDDIKQYKCKSMENKPIHRFYYYKKLNNNFDKTLTIILLNPVFADADVPNATIKNIKKFIKSDKKMQEKKYGGFEILNLFSVRTPKVHLLGELVEKYKNDANENFIIKHLGTHKNDILLAWGKVKKINLNCEAQARKMMDIIRASGNDTYVYSLNYNNTPMHFSPPAYNPCKDRRFRMIKICDDYTLEYVET